MSVGIVQDGKVVFAGGFGVRELGNPGARRCRHALHDRFEHQGLVHIAPGKLVGEGKLTWEAPVTSVWPAFKVGDPETTSQVLVEHLVCACTGMPRIQDMEWLFEWAGATPDRRHGNPRHHATHE